MRNIQNLPYDVIINHILPYTYETQPKQLLNDIQSYVKDYSLVYDIYMTQFNHFILLRDLLRFCKINLTLSYGIVNVFEYILRRHFSICNKCDECLITMVRCNFHKQLDNHTERKIKTIWGLLTAGERTNFINKYINNI